jgi:hypothetical protein
MGAKFAKEKLTAGLLGSSREEVKRQPTDCADIVLLKKKLHPQIPQIYTDSPKGTYRRITVAAHPAV